MEKEFQQYVEQHRAELFAAAYGITRDPHDAEDAVQEAVVSAYLKLDQCRGSESLPNWIRTITMNSARKVIRSRKRQLPGHELGEHDQLVATETVVEDEDELAPASAVASALSSLPPEQAAALLSHYEGKSTAEIAQDLGMAEGTLRSQMSRARDKLLDPLVKKAVAVLAESYGQTFEPSLKRRTQLIPVQLLYRAGPYVAVLGRPDGSSAFALTFGARKVLYGSAAKGLARASTEGCPAHLKGAAEASDSRGIVLDVGPDFHGVARRWVDGELVDEPWSRAIQEALDRGEPISLTREALERAQGGKPRSMGELRRAADQIARAFAEAPDRRKRRIEEGARALLSEDAETCVHGASLLIHHQCELGTVRHELERRTFRGEFEARRLAALGYLAQLENELDAAVALYQRAIKKEQSAWEWSYRLAVVLSRKGMASEAASHLVRALRKDEEGRAYRLIKRNPYLRPLLRIPRMWRMLPPTPAAGSVPTFLPPFLDRIAVPMQLQPAG